MIEEDYNFFLRNDNANTDSDSISNIKENASTYMGVKTIKEGTVADTNKKEKKEKKKNKKSKFKKKKKKRKKSSSSESSSYSSSSDSDFSLKENTNIENNNFSGDENINNNDQENKKYNEDKNNEDNFNKNKEEIKNEINTEFFWDEGGNSIFLTGSFCQWKDFYLMEKKDNNIFYKNLMLPPGFHQYKFKVDNNWAYSKKQPKFEDSSGNVNNFIDTTNYEIKKEIKKTKSEKSPKKKSKNGKKRKGI